MVSTLLYLHTIFLEYLEFVLDAVLLLNGTGNIRESYVETKGGKVL